MSEFTGTFGGAERITGADTLFEPDKSRMTELPEAVKRPDDFGLGGANFGLGTSNLKPTGSYLQSEPAIDSDWQDNYTS